VSGAGSRNKGLEYERRMEDFLNSRGVDVHRTAPSGYEGTDIISRGDTRPRFIADCKNQNSLRLGLWIPQVEKDVTLWQEFSGEPEPRIPLVIHKRARHNHTTLEGQAGQWVTMTAGAFADLINQARLQE